MCGLRMGRGTRRGMVNSPGHMRAPFPSDVASTALKEQDAIDVIWEFEASRDYDSAPGPEQVVSRSWLSTSLMTG
jgi:hypothetical protein